MDPREDMFKFACGYTGGALLMDQSDGSVMVSDLPNLGAQQRCQFRHPIGTPSPERQRYQN